MADNKKTEAVELTQVVTETAPAFKLPNGEIVSANDYFVWLGNLLWEIKANLIGTK